MLCRSKIIRFAAENWDIGRRQTENYIAEARAMQAKDCALHGRLIWQKCWHGLGITSRQAAATWSATGCN